MNYGFHTNKNDGKSQQINMQEANSSSCVNIDLHPQTSQQSNTINTKTEYRPTSTSSHQQNLLA